MEDNKEEPTWRTGMSINGEQYHNVRLLPKSLADKIVQDLKDRGIAYMCFDTAAVKD